LQTQLRSEDGRSSPKEEEQSRRAKFSPHFGFKLATGAERATAIASANPASCF